ncbi:ribonuclease H-like domain-containing protein [Tanacetum coccineum]
MTQTSNQLEFLWFNVPMELVEKLPMAAAYVERPFGEAFYQQKMIRNELPKDLLICWWTELGYFMDSFKIGNSVSSVRYHLYVLLPFSRCGEDRVHLIEEEDGEWIRFLGGNSSSGIKKYQGLNSSDGDENTGGIILSVEFSEELKELLPNEAGKESDETEESRGKQKDFMPYGFEKEEMWIEKYFQVQDYALWDVIENGNSFKPAAKTTTNVDGTSTTLIPGPVTTEEKAQKKNNMKAIKFGGNEATKKTQKTLLKQMYENFSAPSTESLDSIFNRLQKIIIEQGGYETASSSSSSQNMAFVSSPSSTNEVNTAYRVSTANTQVSPASTQVSTSSTQVSTANLSDDTVYAFLASQPNGSQLVYEDLEQIHEDDIEEMDLKWQLALLSMRTRRFFQKTSRKITINGSDTARYDKSKVECFNCRKMGHFARECKGPKN